MRSFVECWRLGHFSRFFILTSSGNRYLVASSDHASINPQGTQVVVWLDDESSVILSGLHITAVEKQAPEKAKAA